MSTPCRAAFHEAAHAVAEYLQGGRLREVEVLGKGDGAGGWCVTTGRATPAGLLAGIIAERAQFGSAPDYAGEPDRIKCAYILRRYHTGTTEAQATAEAHRLLRAGWPAVRALAYALDGAPKLAGADAERIINQALPPAERVTVTYRRLGAALAALSETHTDKARGHG